MGLSETVRNDLFWDAHQVVEFVRQEFFPQRFHTDCVSLSLMPGVTATLEIATIDIGTTANMQVGGFAQNGNPYDREASLTTEGIGGLNPPYSGGWWSTNINAPDWAYKTITLPEADLTSRDGSHPNGSWTYDGLLWRDRNTYDRDNATGFLATEVETKINTLGLLLDVFRYQQRRDLPDVRYKEPGLYENTAFESTEWIIGARVLIEDFPEGLGRSATYPETLYGLGRITFGRV